jgi:hypothetical protein
MKMICNFQRIAGLASATMMLALVGCASNRYDRTAGEFVDDKMLVKRVKNALDDQPVYKYPDVKVNTFRGVVQLSGFVATPPQKEAATEIAERVRGVAEVENNILIAPLERSAVRDYIPGREEGDSSRAQNTNDFDRPTGSAPSGTATASGSTTNRLTR